MRPGYCGLRHAAWGTRVAERKLHSFNDSSLPMPLPLVVGIHGDASRTCGLSQRSARRRRSNAPHRPCPPRRPRGQRQVSEVRTGALRYWEAEASSYMLHVTAAVHTPLNKVWGPWSKRHRSCGRTDPLHPKNVYQHERPCVSHINLGLLSQKWRCVCRSTNRRRHSSSRPPSLSPFKVSCFLLCASLAPFPRPGPMIQRR